MHTYTRDEEEIKCIQCDCRPSGQWALLSCNLREEIEEYTPYMCETLLIDYPWEFARGHYDEYASEVLVNHQMTDTTGWETPATLAYSLGRGHRLMIRIKEEKRANNAAQTC